MSATIECILCGAEYQDPREHTGGACAQEQIAKHESDEHETLTRRQRLLARTLAAVLVAMAAGKRPLPDALIAIVQEWGGELQCP